MVPASPSRPRPSHDRRRSRAVAATVALAVVLTAALAAGYAGGLRVNLQTGSVPVPTAATAPEDVVRSYVEAYDDRDFATMEAIYPSGQSATARFRVMGTMTDLQIVGGRFATASDLSGTSPQAGHQYYRVEVRVDYTGIQDSDLSYAEGPNGWTYSLERSSTARPWTITDHGNG